MSAEAMAIALHHSKAKGAAKLVLIGIANHDGDGGAWPSVPTLAVYAGVTPRNVQKHVETLIKLGEIHRDINGGGNRQTADHARPNLYHFVLKCPPACDGSKNHKMPRASRAKPVDKSPERPLSPATPPVASDTPPPVASDTRTILRTKPLENSIPTQVTGPVDNSRCNWNRFDHRSEHYAAPGVTGRDDWSCIRCGYVTPGVPTLAQIAASLAAEANA